jgi:hypothetical protein
MRVLNEIAGLAHLRWRVRFRHSGVRRARNARYIHLDRLHPPV